MDTNKIKALLESKNVAEGMDKEKLTKIGQEAQQGFESDCRSRIEWETAMDQWMKLAQQVCEQKNYPWRGASNVKYPLVSTAAMQFAARSYPSLVPSDRKVVKSSPIGHDPDGSKAATADAVSTYMSYQLMDEMDCWEEDMDKLLLMLPIVGLAFKKTYWDSVNKKNCSRLVLPKNLVVDYWAKNLPEAERISEIFTLTKRKVRERVNAKLWLDVDLEEPTNEQTNGADTDDTTPYEFVEQHTFLDLDDDDYAEPYIVTFQRKSGTVVRICARFDDDTMVMSDSGDLIQIDPIQYYTKFGFIPNPDGGFYDMGFGTLLGPLNESVNTLINQLIDSGHLSSLQAGFIGKGLRMRMGETAFKPGEWKVVNATGDDLKKQIVPLPTKEPSNVLFELMGSLITSGKELASVAEIFVGKMPGQNTPATTTMASIDQGMKVFTAVYKRIYRSLDEEFKKLYRLNAVYLNPNTPVDVIGMSIGPDAFKVDQNKIYPGADPSAFSQTEKLTKAQGLMELLQAGMPLDPLKVCQRILEAQEQPNWQELFTQQVQQTGTMPPPAPDPKLMAVQAKMQADQSKAQNDIQVSQTKAALDTQTTQAQLQMKQEAHQMDMSKKAQDIALEAESARQRQNIRTGDAASQAVQSALQAHQEMHQSEQQHQQKMVHAAHETAAKVSAVKQMAKAKPTKGATKK